MLILRNQITSTKLILKKFILTAFKICLNLNVVYKKVLYFYKKLNYLIHFLYF